ncbi:Glr-4 [Aphelenchoides besseyi]|nr:Glr-4 [Aphelenchoides besseyi]
MLSTVRIPMERFWFSIWVIWFSTSGTAMEFNIGVIHGMEDSMVWHNVRHAIDEFNMVNIALPIPLTLDLVSPTDPFGGVEDRFCDVVQRKLIGLIVPAEVLTADELMLVYSMCNRFHMPCLTTDDHLLSGSGDNFYVHNVAPPTGTIGKAAAQLISSLAWNSFVLVYEKAEDLVQITDLLSIYYNEHGTRTAVVHTKNIGVIHELLLRANRMSMCDYKYSYLFTHPDLSLLDDVLGFDRYNYRCNISGIRMSQKQPFVKAELAVAIDAVKLFGEALKTMTRRPLLPETSSVLCDAGDVWQDGELFNTALRQSVVSDPTGMFRFSPIRDKTLARANVTLEGVTRSQGHFNEIGKWSSADEKWNFDEKYENKWKFKKKGDQIDLSGVSLRVVVYLEEPFVIRVDDPLEATGFRYDGFCIDLLREMSIILNFTFEIIEVEDGTYGVQDETGRWNGIIGVLQRHEADLSVSAVTITYSRVKVIDFTLPFMHLGISILLSNKVEDPLVNQDDGQIFGGSTLFAFLQPLSFTVWFALICAYLSVAATMSVVARFSPYEWYNIEELDARDKSKANHKNQFTIFNSLWFAIGSLMQQGSDVIPRAAATRSVAVMWWCFTLLVISSYTAQLAAFLTVERMSTSIENAMDLASQQRIKFGTLSNGSTMAFFRESKIPIYERMWSVMQSTSPTVFVNSSKEGIARVKAGNYAYMMESTMIEYYKGHDCALETIGGLLDSKGYGIAVPKGSPLRDILSKAILRLQERTTLEALKNKWWMRRNTQEVRSCPVVDTHSSLRRVYGIFFVLFAAIIVAVLVAIGEYFVESKQQSPRLDFTLLGRLSAVFLHKRKKPETMSGLRKRLQMYDGLYGAIPMGNLYLLDQQRRAALAARFMSGATNPPEELSPSPRTLSPTSSRLDGSPIGRRERTPSKEEIRKISRLIPASDAGLLSRRLSSNVQI